MTGTARAPPKLEAGKSEESTEAHSQPSCGHAPLQSLEACSTYRLMVSAIPAGT
jgi:hypothetical protein